MGIIDTLRRTISTVSEPRVRRCDWCRAEPVTFRSSGGYHYCSTRCEADDAADQADSPL